MMPFGRCSDHQVMSADHLPSPYQLRLDLRVNTRHVGGEIQDRNVCENRLDKRLPLRSAGFGVRPVDAHKQFGHRHRADEYLVRDLPGRKIDRLARSLERSENDRVHYQSHGSASLGNP
jgi:hypothetical protein